MAGPNDPGSDDYDDASMDEKLDDNNAHEIDGSINGLLTRNHKQMKRSLSGSNRVVSHNNQQVFQPRVKIAPVFFF